MIMKIRIRRTIGSRFTLLMLLVFCGMIFIGCQTMAGHRSQNQDKISVDETLSSIAGALSGKSLTPEQMQNLKKQIKTDKEAQTAIETIGHSLSGEQSSPKYCPVDGQRYAPHMEVCPIHQVALKPVEQ